MAGSLLWPNPPWFMRSMAAAYGRIVQVPVDQAVAAVSARSPPIGTSVTVFISPGSKRTAVPAGRSSRMP